MLAAEITNSTVDWSQLDPMITATIAELERAGVSGRPEAALADTPYWNEEHMDEVIANKHVQVRRIVVLKPLRCLISSIKQ